MAQHGRRIAGLVVSWGWGGLLWAPSSGQVLRHLGRTQLPRAPAGPPCASAVGQGSGGRGLPGARAEPIHQLVGLQQHLRPYPCRAAAVRAAAVLNHQLLRDVPHLLGTVQPSPRERWVLLPAASSPPCPRARIHLTSASPQCSTRGRTSPSASQASGRTSCRRRTPPSPSWGPPSCTPACSSHGACARGVGRQGACSTVPSGHGQPDRHRTGTPSPGCGMASGAGGCLEGCRGGQGQCSDPRHGTAAFLRPCQIHGMGWGPGTGRWVPVLGFLPLSRAQ